MESRVKDAAPRDALDQMHRYRDAILWRQKKDDPEKSLEVLGAYVLFPADETSEGRVYPYMDLLMSQNIAAFPLLPEKMQKLTDHIRYIVEERIQFKSSDQNWLKSDVIPHKGLSYVVGDGFGEGDVWEYSVGALMWDAIIKTGQCPIEERTLESAGRKPETISYLRLKVPNRADVMLKVNGITNARGDGIGTLNDFQKSALLGSRKAERFIVFSVAKTSV